MRSIRKGRSQLSLVERKKRKEKKRTHSGLLLMAHSLFHVIGMSNNLEVSTAHTRVTWYISGEHACPSDVGE